MQNLLIEQRGPQGLLKTWRVRPEQKSVSFGHSKHAELRSPLETVKGIQGVFEFRDNQWFYLNLDVRTQQTEGLVEMRLDQPTEIRLGTITLSVKPLDVKAVLFHDVNDADFLKQTAEKKPYQLMTVHFDQKLLETLVLPLGAVYTSRWDKEQTKISAQQSADWMRSKIGSVEISQRTIYLTSVEAMRVISKDQMIDEGGRKTLFATLGGAALLALMFLLSPNSENAAEVAIAAAPPQEYREIKTVVPKRKKQSAPAEVQPQPAQQQQVQVKNPDPTPAAPSAQAGGKTASAIKALGQSRISQLIGKISAGASKSKNVVVTNGIAAGSAPSGRAMAALGSVTQSGRDYSGDGKGQGVKIGTAGHAGGGDAKGLGGIAGGKAGSGGVGLLEEDGEVTGGLDREVIAAYIRSRLGEILYCYERQLSAQPDLYGKVAVKFTIGSNGGVETQRVGETTLKSATVEGCILQKVGKWNFPKPDGGTKVIVTYPFLFKSTN